MIRDQHLANWSRRLQDDLLRFEKLTADISQQQAVWKPSLDKWSVAECIEHLNIGIESNNKSMGPALRRARKRGLTGAGPWRRWTVPGKLLLQFLDPATKRSLPAPSFLKPRAAKNLDFVDVRARFQRGLEELLELAEEADGLNLDRVRLATPASRVIRITAAEAFRIQALHVPRHLSQAEKVTRLPDFPQSRPPLVL